MRLVINDKNFKRFDTDEMISEMFDNAVSFKASYEQTAIAECVSHNWHKIAELKCDNSDKCVTLNVSAAKRPDINGEPELVVVADDELTSVTKTCAVTKEALAETIDIAVHDSYTDWIKYGANRDETEYNDDLLDWRN